MRRYKKILLQEVGVSKHVPIKNLHSPSIFETKNGALGSIISLKGISFATQTIDNINSARSYWHNALSLLDDRFCISVYIKRKRLDISLKGDFKDELSKTIDKAYYQKFKDNNCYQNEIYLSLILKGMSSSKYGKLDNFLSKILAKKNKSNNKSHKSYFTQNNIAELTRARDQLVASLEIFGPQVLGELDKKNNLSEVMSFFASFINSFGNNYNNKFAYPKCDIKGDIKCDIEEDLNNSFFNKNSSNSKIINKIDNTSQLDCFYPNIDLAHYICARRIFFGKVIEFQSLDLEENLYASMLSVKIYPANTSADMLDNLLHIDSEFILTNHFLIEPNDVAQKKISKQIIRLDNSNDPAISQQLDLESCQDALASDKIKVGKHQNTLMIFANNLDSLNKNIQQAVKIYAEAGIILIQESIGQEAAFWSQLPGNMQHIVRATLVTSFNYIDFCPLHNYHTGLFKQNHLQQPVALLQSPAKTPIFFHFHAKGSGDLNDLTPGHTTIIGGNGSGKSVFMGFMDSQLSRFGGKSFFFDRDRGLELYVRACDGAYYAFNPIKNKIKLNPFKLKDTPENRAFLSIWLVNLVSDNKDISPKISNLFASCVDYAYEHLSFDDRCLSRALDLVPIDFSLQASLDRWINTGCFASLFDNKDEDLDFNNNRVGFDLTALLDNDLDPNVLKSVCMYLMHRIKQTFDGSRVSLFMDEGWQLLDNDYWTEQLKKDLPTLRKLNAHIILATQSPESVISSSLSAQFLDNCATNIFFVNDKANFEKHYKHFNLSISEFEFVKNTQNSKRLFLYKQSKDSKICKLNLEGLDDILVLLSGNKRTLALFDKVVKGLGDSLGDRPGSRLGDSLGDRPGSRLGGCLDIKAKTWLPVFLEKFKQGDASAHR